MPSCIRTYSPFFDPNAKNTIIGKHGNDRSGAIGGQNGKTEKYPVPFFANQVHLLGI
jgi:hypothetical protein